MSHCAGLLGRIFGHRYEARYDVGTPTIQLPTWSGSVHMPLQSELEAFRLSRPTTYLGDVCSRCGDVANKRK